MPQPIHWQPIGFLPQLADMVDGMLESAEENLASLKLARPGSLDDYTVGRVVEVYTAQRDDLWLYEQQLQRWRAVQLTPAQQGEVERLEGQVKRLRESVTANLALADKLKATTIEAIMSKTDEQLGLEFLLGRIGDDEER